MLLSAIAVTSRETHMLWAILFPPFIMLFLIIWLLMAAICAGLPVIIPLPGNLAFWIFSLCRCWLCSK